MARRRKRSKKWISTVFILILLVAAGVVIYLVWDNYFNDKKEEPKTDETVVVDDGLKPTESESKPEVQEVEQKEEVVQYDGENPNNGGELTGVVTYAGVSGGKLMIRVNINQYLSGGSCNLRLLSSDGSVAYDDVAGITDSASTSTCEGFDVSTAGLAGGSYEIVIDLISGGKTGTINGEVGL